MKELCQKAKKGDTAAFAELYGQIAPKLYATAYNLLGRKEDAEDVVMETVTDAFASIHKLRDDSAFGGWIFAILMNKLRRRRKEYATCREQELSWDMPAEGGAPDAEKAMIWQALYSLPPQDREIIVLSVLGGYESQEVGRILSINANTVRSRKMRAFARLREMLGEEENVG